MWVTGEPRARGRRLYWSQDKEECRVIILYSTLLYSSILYYATLNYSILYYTGGSCNKETGGSTSPEAALNPEVAKEQASP